MSGKYKLLTPTVHLVVTDDEKQVQLVAKDYDDLVMMSLFVGEDGVDHASYMIKEMYRVAREALISLFDCDPKRMANCHTTAFGDLSEIPEELPRSGTISILLQDPAGEYIAMETSLRGHPTDLQDFYSSRHFKATTIEEALTGMRHTTPVSLPSEQANNFLANVLGDDHKTMVHNLLEAYATL